MTAARRGDLDGARRIYRQFLAEHPESPEGLFALGSLELGAGQPGAARDCFERLAELQPALAEAQIGLARVHLAVGDRSAAETHARRALGMSPDAAVVCRECGRLLLSLGLHAEAAESLSRAATMLPEDPACLDALGEALMLSGDLPGAEQAFRDAIRLDPGTASPRFGLASLLLASGRGPEGIEMLEKGHRMAPGDPRGLHLLGQAYLEQSMAENASQLLERAAMADPGNPSIRCDLGLARQAAGDLAAARADYERSLALHSGHTGALRGLGRLAELEGRIEEGIALLSPHAQSDDGLLLAVLGRLLQQAGRGDEAVRILNRALTTSRQDGDRLHLHFALASIHDAAGRWEEAFEHCRLANELKRVEFDPVAYAGLVDRLLAILDKTSLKAAPRARNEDPRPVFIVGMPRSGTSLVEQIIASHPAAHGAGELPNIGYLALSTAGEGLEYPESLPRLDEAVISAMAREYLAHIDGLAPEAERVTDKMWQNFEYLGLVSLMFPAARVIDCRRDPMDTAISCYFQHFFGTGAAFSYDLEHLGLYYRQYERMMAHWQQVLDIPILQLQYEALVSEPESQARRLIEFLDLPWDEACLRSHETDRVVRTASYAQVRRPIYNSSVGRHRHYDQWLTPLRETLG